MSTAAIERHALRTLSLAPALAIAGATAFLLARLWPDVGGKPFHEDEAVAGLISSRPLGDLLHTVVLDRGGAPLHFLLAHTALAIDPTPEAVRWVRSCSHSRPCRSVTTSRVASRVAVQGSLRSVSPPRLSCF